MKKCIAILMVLCILGLPQIANAEESPNGVISGQLVNGTEDGGSVTGDNVTLLAFINGAEEEIQTLAADDEGKFQFDSLSTDNQYLLVINHAGVDYYFQVTFGVGETEKVVELQVFDATASDQAISIRLAHAIIYVEEEYLSVTQVFWLLNNGDRIYVGDTAGTFVFTLPAQAFDFKAPVELLPGYRLLDDNKVAYDEAFQPGEIQLVYSFKLVKPDSGDYDTAFTVNYPTEEFHLMVQGENVNVTSTQLSSGEPIVTGTGQSFLYFSGGDFPRGTAIDVHIRNLSAGSPVTLIISIIVAIAVIGVIIYFVIRKRSRPATTKAGNFGAGTRIQGKKLKQERDQLTDDFQQGLISEDMYRQLLSEKNAQLKNIESQQGRKNNADE